MPIITLEEHYVIPEVLESIAALQSAGRVDFVKAVQGKLLDLGEERIADMDASGIDMQVLSLVAGGLDRLDGDTATSLAHDANERLAAAVHDHPGRFAGFAAIAMQQPEQAAIELERCINAHGFKGTLISGTVGGLFLDDPRFIPIFEAAQALDVPIYLHPAPPPKPVQDAYFSGLPAGVSYLLSTAAWGWHTETGLHVLRLILSGIFDRFPELKIIIGHMGENLPFSIARADAILSREPGRLKRRVAEYFHEHFWITTSGYFTHPPFLCALQVVGADRLLFSVDYPFSPNAAGRAFLDSLPLSPADRDKISYGNAEWLLHL